MWGCLGLSMSFTQQEVFSKPKQANWCTKCLFILNSDWTCKVIKVGMMINLWLLYYFWFWKSRKLIYYTLFNHFHTSNTAAQMSYYIHFNLCTVQVQPEFKIKILVQNQDRRLLSKQTFGTTICFPEVLKDTPIGF